MLSAIMVFPGAILVFIPPLSIPTDFIAGGVAEFLSICRPEDVIKRHLL
jgi:hypothetical protein